MAWILAVLRYVYTLIFGSCWSVWWMRPFITNRFCIDRRFPFWCDQNTRITVSCHFMQIYTSSKGQASGLWLVYFDPSCLFCMSNDGHENVYTNAESWNSTKHTFRYERHLLCFCSHCSYLRSKNEVNDNSREKILLTYVTSGQPCLLMKKYTRLRADFRCRVFEQINSAIIDDDSL